MEFGTLIHGTEQREHGIGMRSRSMVIGGRGVEGMERGGSDGKEVTSTMLHVLCKTVSERTIK